MFMEPQSSQPTAGLQHAVFRLQQEDNLIAYHGIVKPENTRS